MIGLGALAGGLSPFCSCGVIPLIAALLAMGVPLSAVMAFWLASPIMDPSMFVLTAGVLDLEFAVAKTLAAIGSGLFGGLVVHISGQGGALADPLREGIGNGGCGGSGPGAEARGLALLDRARAPREVRREATEDDALPRQVADAGLPAREPDARLDPGRDGDGALGGDGLLPIVTATLVGVPAYLNGYAALPLVGGLIEQGMAPGAGMAFLVAGGVTSIPRRWRSGRWRAAVFALYIGLSLSGAFAAGLLFQLWTGVLMLSNLVFAAGLGLLAAAPSPVRSVPRLGRHRARHGDRSLRGGFATLAGIYGKDARGPITGITLIAGFASTVGWPLSGLMLATWGWREACLGWALIHLFLALPLNAVLPGGSKTVPTSAPEPTRARRRRPLRLSLLAFVFAATWFNSTAMAAHLPGLLREAGASTAVAIAAGALIGPAQVAARVLEFGFLRRFHPLISTRVAAAAHPVAAVALVAFRADRPPMPSRSCTGRETASSRSRRGRCPSRSSGRRATGNASAG
jgi:uncharacterized protein